MDDLIQQAAQAILPFLGAGAGAAAHGFAEQTGASLSDKSLRVVDRVKQRLTPPEFSVPSVGEAIAVAVQEGAVDEADLSALVAEASQVRTQIFSGGGTVFNGPITQHAGGSIFNGPVETEVFNE